MKDVSSEDGGGDVTEVGGRIGAVGEERLMDGGGVGVGGGEDWTFVGSLVTFLKHLHQVTAAAAAVAW